MIRGKFEAKIDEIDNGDDPSLDRYSFITILEEAKEDLKDRLSKIEKEAHERVRPGTMLDTSHIRLYIYGQWAKDWFGE